MPANQHAPPVNDHRYQHRGVSAGKADVHAAIAGQDPGLFPGAFCKLVPDDLGGSPAHALLVHADTAGTKSAAAYLAWREGASVEVFAGLAQDCLAMNLDDCGCVGALGPFLISNTIGRNAKRIPGEVLKAIIDGYQRTCDLLNGEGIPCRMTGGETADVGDIVRTIDVGCTVVARMPRASVIDAARIAPGDVLIGFSGTGRARWETHDNSGMGCNGLTGARHELLGGYAASHPESFAPEMPQGLAYSGKFRIADPLPGSAMTVGQALLSPTRVYLPLIRALIAEIPTTDLHGLIHATGGGQTKILKFGAPGAPRGNRYVKDALFPLPPLFAAIQAAGVSWEEMHRVYNMGHRLEAAVPPARAETCIAIAHACGIEARRIGYVEASDRPGNEVVIRGPHGEFRYR